MKKIKNKKGGKVKVSDVLQMAIKAHQSGKIMDAVRLYQSILAEEPNQADALHYLGMAQHQLGSNEEAIVLIKRAIDKAPDYIDAQNNLGNVLKEMGQLNEAELAYRAVIAARPRFAPAYNNLGVVLAAQVRFVDAIDAYHQCLSLQPEFAQAWHNLGNAHKKNHEIEDALSAYRQAIMLAPYVVSAYQDLGSALAMHKRFEEALEVYQRWKALEPDNPVIDHMIAAYAGTATPSRASDGYVQKTFDSFAESFDSVLADLNYRAPALTGELVAQLLGAPTKALEILDAGCGTGLCAHYLSAYSRRLVGVDLSAGMLAKAATRNLYSELVKEELTAYLATQIDAYDLIVSADTLCYFGALDDFISAAAHAMRIGGVLVFTVEETPETSDVPLFLLHPHGRYSHTENYIRQILLEANLEICHINRVTLRQESDLPVGGLLVAAKTVQKGVLV